jgi:hypothetical protein
MRCAPDAGWGNYWGNEGILDVQREQRRERDGLIHPIVIKVVTRRIWSALKNTDHTVTSPLMTTTVTLSFLEGRGFVVVVAWTRLAVHPTPGGKQFGATTHVGTQQRARTGVIPRCLNT